MSSLTLNVNDQYHTVSVSDPGMPLLWVLRDLIGLTGTKYGCGIEVCGACTVLVDGQRGALLRLRRLVGGGQARSRPSRDCRRSQPSAQQAWIAHQVPQCGYCQSGHADGGGRAR